MTGKMGTDEMLNPGYSSFVNNRMSFLCAHTPAENHPIFSSINELAPLPYLVNKVRVRGFFSFFILLMLAQTVAAANDMVVTQQYEVKGTARLAFPVSKSQIQDDFAENSKEIEAFYALVSQVLADTTAQIRRIVVCGYGSPDGSYAFNELLARQRADAFLAKATEVGGENLKKASVEVRCVAEDWEGLASLVESVSLEQMPNREDVLKLIRSNRQADDKERVLRKSYPKDFHYLKDYVLPKLRRSDYSIEYQTRYMPSAELMTKAHLELTGLAKDNGSDNVNSEGNVNVDTNVDTNVNGNANVDTNVNGNTNVDTNVNGDDNNVAQQLTGGQHQELQQQIDSLKWWRILLLVLVLLLLLAAGFLIYRFVNAIREKDITIERLRNEVNWYRNVVNANEPQRTVVPSVSRPKTENLPKTEEEQEIEETIEHSDSERKAESISIAPVASVSAPIIETERENVAPKDNGEPSLLNSPDDFERFQKMDKEVTEKRLYLDGDLNRRQLMRIAGVDKNRFAAMIRQYASTNFSGYINSKRMEYAAQLISEHPEYTMKMIAEACGFNSQSTFFRVFKSVYGITPIELSQSGKSTEVSDIQKDNKLPKSQNGQNENPKEQLIRFAPED